MRFRVFAEMIAAHESLRATWTGESLFSGVSSQVTLQLIGPRESLTAKSPSTRERSFSGVPAEVGLQVGGLGVGLTTTTHVTRVNGSRDDGVRCGARHAPDAGHRGGGYRFHSIGFQAIGAIAVKSG